MKLVLKFGGSQVKNTEAILESGNIIKQTYENEKPDLLVAVISALGKYGNLAFEDKITNLLEQIHKKENVKENLEAILSRHEQISKELGIDADELKPFIDELKESIDYNKGSDLYYSVIAGFGERVSSLLVAKKLNAEWLDFNKFGMITAEYKDASASEEANILIEKAFKNKKGIIILPGFVGYNKYGEITTLGRDGSNYTATKIAEAILADEVRIYSDEPGVRRANPQYVPDAEIIRQLSYDEAREFAELGAKIINAKAIGPAKNENIPIRIIDAKARGTIITSYIDEGYMGAKIIASSPNHHILTVDYETEKPGVLAKLADLFAEENINIESIADERHRISFAFLPCERIGNILAKLNNYSFRLDSNRARISLIGEGMHNQIGVIEKITKVYKKKGISFEMISQAASQLNVTNFILDKYERIAVRGLYDEFFRNNSIKN